METDANLDSDSATTDQSATSGQTSTADTSGGDGPTDAHHDWVASTFGFDPRSHASSDDTGSNDTGSNDTGSDDAGSANRSADTSAAQANDSQSNQSQSNQSQANQSQGSGQQDSGGLLGGLIDSARNAASSASDALTDTTQQVAQAATSAADAVADTVSSAASQAQAAVSDAVTTAAQDVGQAVNTVADSVSTAATTPATLPVTDAVNAAPGLAAAPSAPLGSAVEFEVKAKVATVDLTYFDADGIVSYKVSYEPADAGEPDGAVKLVNGKTECEAALKTKFGHDVTLKGGGKASADKGEMTVELEIPTSERAKTTFAFAAADVDIKQAKVKFAEVKWVQEYTLVSGTFDISTMKIKYSGKVAAEVDFAPKWGTIAKDAAEKFGVEWGAEAAVDLAFTVSLGAVALATIAACANEAVEIADLNNLKAAVATGLNSMNAGLRDGLSGADASGSDPIYKQFWTMGNQAFHDAAAKAIDQGLSMDDLTAEAKYQADKTIRGWKQYGAAISTIQWAFFRGWAKDHEGYTTFKASAEEAAAWCFGSSPERDKALAEWEANSKAMRLINKL